MGIFENLLLAGVRAGQMPARTEQARNWYRLMARATGAKIREGGTRAGRIDFGKINEQKLLATYADRGQTTIVPGAMYMYHYDPKFKEELPFYDTFPVVFPFRVEGDRFWALNLHYLDYRYRAILMDALYDITNNKKYDETTRLQMTYKLLLSSSKFKYFKPCVKQYLFSNVKSKLIYIYPSEWDIAAFMPVEKFQKQTKTQVWADSKKRFGK